MEKYSMYIDRKTLLDILKMTVLPNFNDRFSANPVRFLASYFVDIDKQI